MLNLGTAQFRVMKRLDGAKFNGHLTGTSAATTKEKAPYRVLYVRRPSFIVAGDTVKALGSEVVILMEHPDDFAEAKSLKAVYALETMSWKRQTTALDPVARVQKDLGYTTMGTLYVNFDMAEEIDFEGFADTKYRFITGQDVRVDDKINDKWIVKRVVRSLGVNLVYAA